MFLLKTLLLRFPMCYRRPAVMRFRLFRWSIFALLILASPFSFAQQTQTSVDSPFAIPASDEGLPGSGPIRRYDWFKNLWQQKRSGWAEQVTRDKQAVVFLGDSITQGWGDDFGGQFTGMKTANRGISGDTTRGMLIRLQEDVLSLEPSGVVLLMGTNDLEEGASPETIAGNFKLIVAKLKEYDDKMPIIVCQVFPSSESKRRPAEQIQSINRLYSRAVQDDPQITLLDTYSLFANENGDAKPEEFPDLLHPNAAGYKKWGEAIRPLFASLGFLETEAAGAK